MKLIYAIEDVLLEKCALEADNSSYKNSINALNSLVERNKVRIENLSKEIVDYQTKRCKHVWDSAGHDSHKNYRVCRICEITEEC